MRVRRFDQNTIKDWNRTPQGGARIPAFPTRTGVFLYLRQDGGIVRELRPAEEVFKAESLATLQHAPVTDLHPEKEGIRIAVTPANYRDLSVGHVAEDVRPEGGMVAATLLVQDESTILKIESGDRRELSCGYSCRLDPTPGVTPEGEIFDAVQRDIQYNHVALGPPGWGRGGSNVALRLDSGDGIQVDKDPPMKETINGQEYTVGTPEWIAAVRAEAQRQVQAEKGRADAADKAAAQAKKDLEAAQDPAKRAAEITRRVRLVTDCRKAAESRGVKFDEAAAAGVSEGELIIQAIKLLDPSFDPNGKTPDYLMGYFESLIKRIGAPASGSAVPEDGGAGGGDPNDPNKQPPAPGAGDPEKKTDSKGKPPSIFDARRGTAPAEKREDANGPDPDKAREDMRKREADAWKQPLAANKDNVRRK